VDPDSARSTLGILPGAALTTNDIEAAYEQARERSAVRVGQSGAALDDGALLRGQLDEARVLLLKRAVRVPPYGEAIGTLTMIQFFVGGFVLFVAAMGLMVGWATWYDGALSLIGWTVGAVWIALASMAVSLVIGLPLRLAPGLRRRWLANGELTIGGAVLGFLATEIVIATAPVSTVVDDLGPYQARDVNGWALFIAWSIFAFSIAHFVWPLRWTRHR
jgi:hypothetical protein